MNASWEDDAPLSPVPRREPPARRPTPEDWDAAYRQTGERLACERLHTAFLTELDALTERQASALASCAYLEEPDLAERLTAIAEQRSQLASEYERHLLTTGASLPEDERSEWLGRFQRACEDRAGMVRTMAELLLEIIQQRGVIEHAHAKRAGVHELAVPPEITPRGEGDV